MSKIALGEMTLASAHKILPLALLIGLFLCAVRTSHAAGFFVPQQSAHSAGRMNIGGSAIAADASTIFTNPAGMTELVGAELQIGATFIIPDIEIENSGSTATTPGTLQTATSYAGVDDTTDRIGAFPTLFIAYPLANKDIWLGLGVSAPFGQSLKYDNDWFGRYDSIKTDLITIDFAPSFAYEINEFLSLGGGVDIQYADATLTNALPDTLNPGGPSPATDGHLELEGDDWSVGFNVGLLFKPQPQTRIGLHYRSKMDHRITGAATLSRLSGLLASANGNFPDATDLNLPDILSLGVAHEVTSDLILLGEVQWFGWDVFKEIRVEFDDGRPDAVVSQDFQDTYAVGLGLEYRWNDMWRFRAGMQYDESPTVDRARNSVIPDSDRFWVSLGATYRPADDLAIDFALAHIFFDKADIDLTRSFYEGTPASGSVDVKGRINARAETLLIGLRYKF